MWFWWINRTIIPNTCAISVFSIFRWILFNVNSIDIYILFSIVIECVYIKMLEWLEPITASESYYALFNLYDYKIHWTAHKCQLFNSVVFFSSSLLLIHWLWVSVIWLNIHWMFVRCELKQLKPNETSKILTFCTVKMNVSLNVCI